MLAFDTAAQSAHFGRQVRRLAFDDWVIPAAPRAPQTGAADHSASIDCALRSGSIEDHCRGRTVSRLVVPVSCVNLSSGSTASRWLTRFGVVLWLMLLLGSGGFLWHYSTAPGAAGAPILAAPAGLDASNRFRLVMFLHPHCSCSRSSVRNLNQLMQTLPGSVSADVDVFFFRPDTLSTDWHQTPLWAAARRIPGAVCHVDPDGRRAAEFGIATSGHVLLFAPGGERVFSGGITSGRGHDGANPGSEAVSRLMRGQASTQNSFAVYGCAIRETAGRQNRTSLK